MANRTYNSINNALLPALLISIGVHLLVVAFLHPWEWENERVLPSLEVALQQPKPVPPPPPPEPPKPEPPKPRPQKILPPVKTPPPTPAPIERAAVVPSVPPPPVITAAPTRDAEPAFVAPPPPPEPAKPHEPAPVDVDADLGKYGSLLAREFAKFKQYPRIAQMRGWQGTVRVKLELDANGNVTSSTISESSGFDALDKQALEMARKASPLPAPPEALRHRPFAITVPVLFRLE